MPASSSVKLSTRHQQTPLLRVKEIQSRPHSQRSIQAQALRLSPSHVDPPASSFSPGSSSGLKRKRSHDDTGSSDEGPSHAKGARPSPFVPQAPGHDEENPAAAVGETSGHDLNDLDLETLSKEAQGFMNLIADHAKTPVEMAVAAVIKKSAAAIYAEALAMIKASSTREEIRIETIHLPVASEYSASDDGSQDLPWGPATPPAAEPTPYEAAPAEVNDEEDASGILSVVSGSDGSETLIESQSQEVHDELEIILGDDGFSNLGADAGDCDHTTEPSYRDDFPWTHLATSASSYSRYSRLRSSACGILPEGDGQVYPALASSASIYEELALAPQSSLPPVILPKPKKRSNRSSRTSSSRSRRTSDSSTKTLVEEARTHHVRKTRQQAKKVGGSLADAVSGAGPSSTTKRTRAQRR